MSDTNKSKSKTNVRALKPKIVNARKDYKCETCNGEFPIMKGLPYISLPVNVNGKLVTKKICFQCWYAICNKLRFGNKSNIDLSTGALRWDSLGKNFKDIWNRYLNILDTLRDTKDEKLRMAYQQMIDEMEYDMSLMENPTENNSQEKNN